MHYFYFRNYEMAFLTYLDNKFWVFSPKDISLTYFVCVCMCSHVHTYAHTCHSVHVRDRVGSRVPSPHVWDTVSCSSPSDYCFSNLVMTLFTISFVCACYELSESWASWESGTSIKHSENSMAFSSEIGFRHWFISLPIWVTLTCLPCDFIGVFYKLFPLSPVLVGVIKF